MRAGSFQRLYISDVQHNARPTVKTGNPTALQPCILSFKQHNPEALGCPGRLASRLSPGGTRAQTWAEFHGLCQSNKMRNGSACVTGISSSLGKICIQVFSKEQAWPCSEEVSDVPVRRQEEHDGRQDEVLRGLERRFSDSRMWIPGRSRGLKLHPS